MSRGLCPGVFCPDTIFESRTMQKYVNSIAFLENDFKRARSCNYGIPKLVQVKMKILYTLLIDEMVFVFGNSLQASQSELIVW